MDSDLYASAANLLNGGITVRTIEDDFDGYLDEDDDEKSATEVTLSDDGDDYSSDRFDESVDDKHTKRLAEKSTSSRPASGQMANKSRPKSGSRAAASHSTAQRPTNVNTRQATHATAIDGVRWSLTFECLVPLMFKDAERCF